MLTSKSMMFNGEYIEDLIEGYTTINVTGREMAEVAVDAIEVGTRDGAIFRGTKYRPRTLTIEFLLEGDDLGFNANNTTLIDRLNQLNGILDVEEEVPIIFRDEPDKFYMGIRQGQPDVVMALGVVKGSFQIYCSDPFKYSAEEYEIEPSFTDTNGFQAFSIDYRGTHKSYPVFEAQFYTQNTAPRISDINVDAPIEDGQEGLLDTTSTGNEDESIGEKGSCGYVAFFDDQEHILQFGNADDDGEPDEEILPTTLVNQNFQSVGTWGESVQALWLANSIVVPETYNQRGFFEVDKSYNNAQSATTEGQLLKDSAGNSTKYTVKVQASKRGISSVKLSLTITSSKFTSALPKKGVLTAHVSVHGETHSKVIQKGALKKGKSISATMTFTVNDLELGTDTLSDIYFEVERTGGSGSVGKRSEVACSSIQIPTYMEPVVDSYYLTMDPNDIAAVNGEYYGPTVYRNIPADGTGGKGWTDWEADFEIKFCQGDTDNNKEQMGAIFVGIVSGTMNNGVLTNPKIAAGVTVRKYEVGSNGYISTIGDGVYQHQDKIFDTSFYNPHFGNNRKAYTTYNTVTETYTVKVKKKTKTKTRTKKVEVQHDAITANRHILIRKEGTTVTFTVGGDVYTWDGASETEKAYRICFGVFGYSGKPRVDWMGIFSAKFTPIKNANNVPVYSVPFKTGDHLRAESYTGDVYLNDILRPELGALGNDWENMYLSPGDINTFFTSFSDWCNKTVYRQCNADDPFLPDEQYYSRSGSAYVEVTITETEFETNPSTYYILETCSPSFKIKYREVFS